MNDIFNPIYRQDYLEGYSNGLNPQFQMNETVDNLAFISGFNSGRFDYESWNGSISNGIPKRIITKEILEDFLLSGLLGLNIDTNDYTIFQLNILSKWYQSGTEKYEPNHSLYLFSILEKNSIQIKNETFYL
ncbi:hypothetical protein OX283_002915 [Flavobacterium sp. SUN052]|uniref:hypothetical protein n=1 Tax=Flavobacterium sp. SUN052 TaxID=3002441 RepID=UPI00237D60F1|nr:hypothetical protein [Flavobacterium sp. SUN052]MEC4003598.1 hypothetical protein [Flavobacterium sp. SUN052]